MSKLTVFLSLFCLRGLLADGVDDFFAGIGVRSGIVDLSGAVDFCGGVIFTFSVGGKLTDIVFKPDKRSLISVGPFISGRVERCMGSG